MFLFCEYKEDSDTTNWRENPTGYGGERQCAARGRARDSLGWGVNRDNTATVIMLMEGQGKDST